MKLSLNELGVDSYATQLNEKEITEIKGGTVSCIPDPKPTPLPTEPVVVIVGGNPPTPPPTRPTLPTTSPFPFLL